MQPKNNPLILIGNAAPSATEKSAQKAGITALPASIGLFASGEPFVELFPKDSSRFADNTAQIKGRDIIVVQSGAEPVGENTTHLLMMVHTLKLHGAGSVTVVMPFAPFMRQDRAFDARFVSLGAAFFANQLKAAGADAVVTLTPHSQAGIKAYQDVFGAQFTAVAATSLFADAVKTSFGNNPAQVSVGAPDGADKAQDEGQQRARALATALFGRNDDAVLFLIAKTHTGISDTKITAFTGDVQNKNCVIIDDMIDGGSTMINAASLLKAKGAASVTACASHGILSGNALEKILSARPDGQQFAIDRLMLTDSLPGVEKKLAQLAEQQPQLAARVCIVPATAALLDAAQTHTAKAAPATNNNAAPRRRAP